MVAFLLLLANKLGRDVTRNFWSDSNAVTNAFKDCPADTKPVNPVEEAASAKVKPTVRRQVLVV